MVCYIFCLFVLLLALELTAFLHQVSVLVTYVKDLFVESEIDPN